MRSVCLRAAGESAISQNDIENVQRVVTGAAVRLKCSVQPRGLWSFFYARHELQLSRPSVRLSHSRIALKQLKVWIVQFSPHTAERLTSL